MLLTVGLRSALSSLNYATPIVVSAFYLLTTAVAWSRLQYEQRSKISNASKSVLLGTSFAITAVYVAEALQFLKGLSIAPDDALVHAISQALLWLTFSLILINTTHPITHVWFTTSILNLTLEGTICALTYTIARNPDHGRFYALGAIQTVICLLLGLYALLTIQVLHFTSTEPGTPETKSLLNKSSTHAKVSAVASASSSNYSTLPSDDNDDNENDETSAREVDQEDVDLSKDDEDDDGDKEVRALLQQRLEANGNWFTYIKEFKVFLPYLIPADNFRIQFYLGLLVFNTLIQRALIVLMPRQLGIVINALTNSNTMPWKEIFVWILLKIAASDSCGVTAVNDLLEHRIAAWSRQKLSVAAFDQVMSLSMGFHDEKDSGEIIKAIEQAGSLNSLLRALIADIVPGFLDVIVALFYVTYLFDVYAMLIMIAVGIVFIFSAYYVTLFSTAARRVSSIQDREESRLVYESVSNWFTISYFNRKTFTMARLASAVKNAAVAGQKSSDMYTYLFGVQELSEMAGLLAISILAARRIVTGASSVGDFVTLESYWFSMTIPLYILGRSYRQLNSDLVDAERLLQLFQQKPDVQDNVGARSIQLTRGEVAFDNVHFAYRGRQTTLTNLNFTAESGKMTALVGETGSGKSTIFKLLMRFHDVTCGKITIDGQDLRDMTLDSLRECFGFVPQDTVLFNMSILENVRYGRLNASDEEVYEACRAAAIHDKILSFPKGYASKVGERGVKLSGGERQRIAIARVFLKNAQIVLLDEATSAMDSQTEAKIQGALKTLIKGRTTFVIAHRLSTIIEADKILVVDNGHVVESGTHQQLLQQGGRYLELWKKQAALAT